MASSPSGISTFAVGHAHNVACPQYSGPVSSRASISLACLIIFSRSFCPGFGDRKPAYIRLARTRMRPRAKGRDIRVLRGDDIAPHGNPLTPLHRPPSAQKAVSAALSDFPFSPICNLQRPILIQHHATGGMLQGNRPHPGVIPKATRCRFPCGQGPVPGSYIPRAYLR